MGWLTEAVLWVSWAHQGSAQTVEEAEVILLDAHEFGKTAEHDVQTWHIWSRYASLYVKSLNRMIENNEDLSDLALGDMCISGVQHTLNKVMREVPRTPDPSSPEKSASQNGEKLREAADAPAQAAATPPQGDA